MKVVKLTCENLGSHCMYPAKELTTVTDEMSDSEVGDKWIIEFVEMTEQEYNALPEFTGW